MSCSVSFLKLQDTNCLLESLFRVRLIGGVEKWENRKLGDNRKMRGYKKFSFLSIVFGWDDGKVEILKIYLFGWKEKWEYEKWSWYKFTIMSLLNKTKK